MFLDKNYVLASELVQTMGIHLANVSMIRKQRIHHDDECTVRKMNNCLFVNRKAKHLPNNIKKGLESTFTDMSNKLPCTYFRSEYNVSERELDYSGIVLGKVLVAGKKFYLFTDEFVNSMKNMVPYILTEQENNECLECGTINGSVRLGKNKFFAWY